VVSIFSEEFLETFEKMDRQTKLYYLAHWREITEAVKESYDRNKILLHQTISFIKWAMGFQDRYGSLELAILIRMELFRNALHDKEKIQLKKRYDLNDKKMQDIIQKHIQTIPQDIYHLSTPEFIQYNNSCLLISIVDLIVLEEKFRFLETIKKILEITIQDDSLLSLHENFKNVRNLSPYMNLLKDCFLKSEVSGSSTVFHEFSKNIDPFLAQYHAGILL